jgi:peptide/nickel transport system substrate-binding protein
VSDWQQLQARAKLGTLSRRDFLRVSAALGVSTSIATGVLSKAGYADEPKKGGTLRLGISGGSTTDNLDPLSYNNSAAVSVGYQIMNGLIEIDAKQNATPELLESWEVQPGAKEWIFNVRKDVTFHNGKSLTADDVIYSVNRNRGKDSKSPIATSLAGITELKKLDEHQIKFTLDSGNADFLYVLADFHLLVVPDGFKDWSKPVGTGAFTLEAWDPGIRAMTKRHHDYWKQGRGYVDAVELTVIADSAARMNALIAGQVDVIDRVDKKAVDLLKSAPSVSLLQSPAGWHGIMAMMMDRKPYDSKDLRLALRYAMDREQALQTLFNGFGSVANDHPVPKSDPFFNSELPQRGFDPDKAAYHFKKADLGGTRIEISASDAAFVGAVDMAVLLQASAKKAGIDLQVKKEPADGFWDNVWLKSPFTISYWNGRPAATEVLGIAYKSDAVWNETHWRNPDFDKMLLQAKAETDTTKRKSYLWEMQRMLYEDGGAIIPVFSDFLDGYSSSVKGQAPHSLFDLCNGRVAEKVWLEA